MVKTPSPERMLTAYLTSVRYTVVAQLPNGDKRITSITVPYASPRNMNDHALKVAERIYPDAASWEVSQTLAR